MTKSELEEYVQELEDAIEEAYAALDDDKLQRARRILSEYIEEEEEPEGEEEGEEEEPEKKNE